MEQGAFRTMKKLLLLSITMFVGHAAFTQHKFKTVKRSNEPVEDIAKKLGIESIDNSIFQQSTARPKFFSQIADNQVYANSIAQRAGLKITRDENGMPLIIEGVPTNVKQGVRSGRVDAVAAAAYNYLEAVKPYLKLKSPDDELTINQTSTDELATTHIKMQQTYRGLPVYGGEMILHKKNNEDVSLLNGRFFPTPDISDVTPTISAESVGQIAAKEVSKMAIVKPMSFAEKAILKYEKPKTTLMIYHQDENLANEHLAYEVTIRPNFLERWVYIIDAKSGEILDKYNHTCSLDGPTKATAADLNGASRSINTYLSGNSYNLIDATKSMFRGGTLSPDDPQGVIWTIDARGSKVNEDLTVRQVSSSNNTWNNPTAISAHYDAGVAYDYYKTYHGRNSLNGKGSTIVSIINITDEDGGGFDNAFWNGEFMGYGNGKDYFKPLAGGLDVAGHEMTHGVIENTANLEYKSQSGAINESLADCFGAMVERKSGTDGWKLGEDVVKAGVYKTGALRDLSNPNNGGTSLNNDGYQPANMNQYYTGSQDNYGVHINSGVPNNAFYRFATATGMSKEKAEKVYYRTLVSYLTRTSKFIDLRRGVIQATTDLYGANGTEVQAAKAAFDAVGITDGSAPTPTPNPTPTPTPTPTTPKADVPVNTGTDFLLSYDPVDKILYKSSTKGETDANSFVELVKNIVLTNKPSVADDGSYAYFVPADGFIKRVNLSGTPKVDNISQTGDWRNVAISKDGKKIAALTKLGSTASENDKSIFVFNLETGKSKQFKLYNPTYTKGVNTGQVQNADAFEWDHQSENIVYDAYNTLKNATGKEVDFWDVGFINVWNASTSNFGTGEIDKLFSGLEEGINIGDPSFAKNSTNIIAFDFFIDKDDTYAIIGTNIDRSDALEFIFFNNTIGYPEYSKKDDFMIFNNDDSKGVSNTYQVTMDNSKIKSVDNSQKSLIGQSAFAVWYSVGTRTLPQKQQQQISLNKLADKTLGDAAFDITATSTANLAVNFTLNYGSATLSGKRVTLGNTAGRVKITAYQDGNTNYYAIAKADSFCVNPTKPSISVIKKKDSKNADYWEYTSSATTGNVWYRDGVILQDLTGDQAIAVNSGATFNVQVVTTDGCKSALSDPRKDVALITVLANEPAFEKSIIVSPNPSSEEINIVLPSTIHIQAVVLNAISGSRVMEKQGDKTNKMTLDIRNLTRGSYLLEIMTNEGTAVKKIVKE